MASKVNVRTATVAVRSVNLTKKLLDQMRRPDRLPDSWWERDSEGRQTTVKAPYVVGWIHHSVFGDFLSRLLLQHDGDCYLWPCHGSSHETLYDQLYV